MALQVNLNTNPNDASTDGTSGRPFSMLSASTQGTFTARSGTIAAGGTSQTLMAGNTARKGFIIQNPLTLAGQGIAAAESLYINFGGAAGVDNGTSIELVAGAIFSSGTFVSTDAITVNATTINHKYIAKEM